ncbi:MAG: DUF1501 domain-containing protein [Pirellulales bacterium]|nr:DUF1501 domain-containing protein [Pirellulales bacterium]
MSEIVDSSQFNRRHLLKAGGQGLLALGAAGLAGRSIPAQSGESRPATAGFGRAKSVVVLYLYGAPSQMDTLDPKPGAPVERRGEFKPISSSMPGIAVCEHLPNVARNLHRCALVRSMTHTSNNHAVSVALSGLSKSEPALEGNGSDPRHYPYIGSVLEYLWKQRGISMLETGVPVNMVLPWALNAKTGPGRWQHHAGWLGRSYSPVIPIFRGEGSLEVGSPSIQGSTPILTRFDPWDGITPESTFHFDGAELPPDVSPKRFEARQQLLATIETGSRRWGPSAETFDHYRRVADAMIAQPSVARALDVTQETDAARERYGYTLFGQSALTARRLIEAGVKIVTVFWDTWTDNNAAWDTHHNHHPRLKNGLLPKFDQILPAFLDDMHERGLLDDTLVMVISEHGRTPTLSNGPGGGREHWAGAYWGLFFGAGIRVGQVIGATDAEGGYPISRPTDPKDILATMYHLLGFDYRALTIPDRFNRPIHLIPHGDTVAELIA